MVFQLSIRRSLLTLDDLSLALKGADLRPTENPLQFQLFHDDKQAWLSIELLANKLVFSLSHSNPLFGKLLVQTVRSAYGLADSLRGQLFLESSPFSPDADVPINQGNLESYTEVDSRELNAIERQWEETLNRINTNNEAPLEFYLGREDAAPEYFCLILQSKSIPTFSSFTDNLGFSVQEKNASQCAVFDKNSQRPLCKLARNEDGGLRIQPFYWKTNFAQAASETMQTAELLQVMLDPLAPLTFFQFPLDDNLRAALLEATSGLGMDFNAWAENYFGENKWKSRRLSAPKAASSW